MTRQYISESALDFSGNPKTRFALEMHHISETTARALVDRGHTPVELDFEGGALVKARLLGDAGHFHPETVEKFADVPNRSSLAPLTTPPVTPLVLTEDPDGASRIGGEAPPELRLPEAAFASGYQLIGEIDLAHVGGAGLVPLIYPMFVDYHPPLFLDVSEPMRPSVFPAHEGRMVNLGKPYRPFTTDALPYGPVREDAEITATFQNRGKVTYREFRGDFRPADVSLPDGMVTAGVPDWLQNPELPLCPKTDEPMRFAAAIGGGLPVATREVEVPDGALYADRFDYMEFWNEGILFVFVHPGGRTLCLHPQDT